MDVVALRIKGRACVIMSKDGPTLVGEKILSDWLASKASSWTEGIPTDAKAIPKGLDPEQVAKWFLYYGSVKKNDALWSKLCSVEEGAIDAKGELESGGRSWWGQLSKKEREYYYLRPNTERGDDKKKYFMYQMKIDGKDSGAAKNMVVVHESTGEWRVASF